MTSIVIHDLPDNLDLDRQAMQAIAGGARTRGVRRGPGYRVTDRTRLVDYPTVPGTETAPRMQAGPVPGEP